MTLHSFGEGSGVGVSFAGSKGFSQGLLVTLAIPVHNIREGLAVSMVLASRGVSPQNAMLWSIITSLPQALTFHLQHAFLMGIASGIAFVLGLWRPLQLLLSAKMGFIPMVSLLIVGAALSHFMSSTILNVTCRKKSRAGSLINSVTNFPTSAITLQSLLARGAVGFHALAEGLALVLAAPKAYGLGRHMVLPVSLHGFPRGTAVASCVFGVTDSWHAALAAAALIGFVGPISAIGSILAGIDYSGLDHMMVVACGGLLPSFWQVIKRAVRLESRKGIVGMLLGIACAVVCLTSTKLVCLHTPYCNSAPEAVR